MRRVPLGEVAKFIRGITFKPEDVVPLEHHDAIAVMRTKNVQHDLALDDVWGIPSAFVRDKTKILRAGDILVSTANSWNLVGKASWVPYLEWQATAGGFISILRAEKSKVDPRFLYNWFVFSETQANVRACANKTTNISNLSIKQTENLEIPLPPLAEQKRIAAILDQADALRRLRQRAIARLDTLGQAIFYEMFGDPCTPREGFAPLGTCLRFVTSGGRGWAKYYSSSGRRFIRSLDVQMNGISNEEIVFVNPPDNAEAKRTHTLPGDVLLTITGSRIGRVCVLSNDFGQAHISQHVAILRLDQTKLLPRFLSEFLSMPDGGQRQIAKAQYGQTKPGLNFEQIRSFQVPAVELEQQARFCNRLNETRTSHDRQLKSLGQLNDLFSSIQFRAFSGDL